MRLPIDVRDLVKAGSKIQETREKTVRIAVFVELDAPDELVEVVRDRLHPFTAGARLHIEVVEPGVELLVDPAADVLVAVVGSGRTGIAQQLETARERAVPTVVIALSEEIGPVADVLGHPYRDTLVSTDSEELVDEKLGEWLVDRIPAKRLALAHNFTFMRRAVAIEAVKATALQNGLIGAVAVIPGADMPLMTANQTKMLLQVAAAYGEKLGVERWRELAAVIGGGFVMRGVARQFLSFVPGFGWAVKGGIGATGTLAMGYAVVSYFEGSADTSGLTERFERMKGQVTASIRERTQRPKAGQTPAIVDASVPAEETFAGDA
ncbi:MAG: hypothetical protein Q8K99_02660 [Actinomycetota bacterium]|nr:hypothetical protein [Actinomycetota bacterium]